MEKADIQQYCDLCGEQYKGRFYAKCSNYQIVSCERCGLLWTYPLKYRSEKADTSKYWAEEIYLANAKLQRKRFRKQIKAFVEKANISDLGAIRVLEVVSGLGFFLDVCEEFGIAAEGCDISEKAVEYANRNRERVRLGTLDSWYEHETFDVVFAFNLIEHLLHPRDFLTEARRVLKQGGKLVLETPIQESLSHKIARLGYFLSKWRLNFFGVGVEPGGHIYKFSKKSFKFICDDMGFRILYQRNINSPFGEIWGKTSLASFGEKLVLRLSIPIVWPMSEATKQENRLFIILQKL